MCAFLCLSVSVCVRVSLVIEVILTIDKVVASSPGTVTGMSDDQKDHPFGKTDQRQKTKKKRGGGEGSVCSVFTQQAFLSAQQPQPGGF